MSDILILSVADLRHMTCANFFCYFLEEHNITFDIICTNRYKEKAKSVYECQLYQYDWIFDKNKSKIKKIIPFLKFKHFAERLIKDNQYRFIIIWGENAALLFDGVLRKYRKKFCCNIRDVYDGKLSFLNKVLKGRAMQYACFSTFPTPKGVEKYTSGKCFVLTNYDYAVEKLYTKPKKLVKSGGQLRITYMGLIYPYIETFKRFICAFKNDERFLISFFGEGADTLLASYAEEQEIYNVRFGGAFLPEKTSQYLEETDIINSVYGTENSGVSGAVGVKESYSPILHIPVISDKGCYWARLSEKYGFGLGVENDFITIPDIIFNWYQSLNAVQFDEACKKYLKKVTVSNKLVEEELCRLLCL